ncbi:conjugal transfer protein TraR [Paenibacillus sambharensis]|uniref:Conjugal transfer protein TraR n=1 Tax=Paenibacillus sambharensis TaxID=1803190 RepID=A0A2W1L0N8_9BACL|nr:TraR/DksA C4-type zinc finger protein [Paenibacillus sambharensis]PZD92916.1 conjugal transfer protein TraR [Paenibacillus sambharensis]
MKHLNEEQLQQLKQQLLDEREQLAGHFDIRDEEIDGEFTISLQDSVGELSSADNHPADLGTETFERERDMALNDNYRGRLEEIEAALERMEEDTYGTCTECGAEIPFERLEAVPETPYCIDHARAQQTMTEKRPVEEDVMTTPPTGAGEARQANNGRFDEADAWKTLEEYGNASDTVNIQEMESDQGERGLHRANSRAK